MADEHIPEWAFGRGYNLCCNEGLSIPFANWAEMPSAKALARLIARTEPPPIDPVNEAMSEAMCGIPGEDYANSVKAFREALAKRGLEIREVGT